MLTYERHSDLLEEAMQHDNKFMHTHMQTEKIGLVAILKLNK